MQTLLIQLNRIISSISLNSNVQFRRPSSSSVEVTTVSAVFSEPSASTAYVSRRNKSNRFKPQNSPLKEVTAQQTQSTTDNIFNRRFKPKIQPSNTEQSDASTSSLYKFKLNRQPGRWQYKTSPKPRVTIRKQSSDDVHPHVETVTSVHEASPDGDDAIDGQTHGDLQIVSASSPADSRSDSDTDLDSSGSIIGDVLDDSDTLDNTIASKKLPIETLKVEISTPADFKDTYYEIATIKSPYTYQVSASTKDGVKLQITFDDYYLHIHILY